MKKKISVFALLLSLILSFVVSVPVAAATETTADDVKYRDIDDFMYSSGYTDFNMKHGAYYVVYQSGGYLYIVEVLFFGECEPYFCYMVDAQRIVSNVGIRSFCLYKYYDFDNASLHNNYTCLDSNNLQGIGTKNVLYNGVERLCLSIDGHFFSQYKFENLIYSDLPLYRNTSTSYENFYFQVNDLIFESCKIDGYSFPSWCSDAGLNCLASTNESVNKIPYSYNSYWHIVRKTSNGKWLLTTVGNSVMQENITDYTMMITEDSNLAVYNLYSGEDVNGYMLNVRQYEYDTDGWKVRTYETYDAREDDDCIIDLGAGSGFDQTRILAYTNTDIYDEGFNVVHTASTEYYEVTTTPPIEEPDSPTPTPTTAPGSGSGSSGSGSGSSGSGRPGSGTRPDTGGQATGGGGLDFIINLFTLIWTKICSIPMAVDGYSISLQQIIIYGALVSIVGGFIMHFIFGRK